MFNIQMENLSLPQLKSSSPGRQILHTAPVLQELKTWDKRTIALVHSNRVVMANCSYVPLWERNNCSFSRTNDRIETAEFI
jgi:hypothetical protein